MGMGQWVYGGLYVAFNIELQGGERSNETVDEIRNQISGICDDMIHTLRLEFTGH